MDLRETAELPIHWLCVVSEAALEVRHFTEEFISLAVIFWLLESLRVFIKRSLTGLSLITRWLERFGLSVE